MNLVRLYLCLAQDGALQVGVELVFRQILLGVNYCHTQGIVHRDLKPDNMMLTKKGAHNSYLKVLDWGIAKPLVEDIDVHLTQGLVGTPHYMAPEQAMNQDIDARTDIYAMAVIFYPKAYGSIGLRVCPKHQSGWRTAVFYTITYVVCPYFFQPGAIAQCRGPGFRCNN